MVINIPTFTNREECFAFALDRQTQRAAGVEPAALEPNASITFGAIESLFVRSEGALCCSFPIGGVWVFVPMSREHFIAQLQNVLNRLQRRQGLQEGIASGRVLG